MEKIDRDFYTAIGLQLRKARESKRMSLQDLSDAIGGMKTKQTIMRYENGTTRIHTDELKAICNVLGIRDEDVVNCARKASSDKKYISAHIDMSDKWDRLMQINQMPVDDPAFAVMSAYESAEPSIQKAVRIILGVEK